MKKLLSTLFFTGASISLFAGEIILDEPFDSQQAVEKFRSSANLSFVKGNKKEVGSIKMQLDEKKSFGGLSIPIDAAKLRGSVVEVSGEVKGENVAKGPKDFNGAKFMLSVTAPSGNVYGGAPLKLGSFDWQKIKTNVRIPHDAQSANLNLGFEQSFGVLYYRNIKIEKKHDYADLRKSANIGFSDQIAGDGKGGWFDLGSDEDASNFQFKYKGPLGNVPYCIIESESNKGKSAILIKPSGTNALGVDKATVELSSPSNAKYLYLLNVLQTPFSGNAAEVTIKSADGKSHIFKLKGGRDVSGWKNIKKDLQNAAVADAWLAKKGYRKSDGIYSTRLQIPEGFGGISSIEFGNAKVPWIIVAATLSEEKIPFPSESKFTVVDGKEWKALPVYQDRTVKEGSALDCSYLWNIGEIKSRVVASKDGRLELADNPNVPVAFQTLADSGFTFNTLLATKESTEAYVKQLRIQGYNMVRFHYFDFSLMAGAKAPLEFNQELLDRIDYYIYCLKKNGIYLNLDAMCSRYGFELGNTWSPDNSGRDYNYDLYFKPSARQNWFDGVKKLLTRVNKYTNTRLVDDPVLAILNGKNEQEFGLMGTPKKPDDMKPSWVAFLKKRYGDSLEKYNKVWKSDAKSWDDIKVYNDTQASKTDDIARDIAVFKLELETEMWKWFEKSFREIGYKGLCGNYDMLKSLRIASVRKHMPMVMMHSYHAHPSPVIGGISRMSQSSSLVNSNGVFRGIAGTALWKKPLLVTEYGHVFWNKYRYEQAFSIGAYAALQGYSALTVHSQLISLWDKSPIRSFGCAPDPIIKAAEFLTTHMLLRKDIAEAKPAVRIDYSTNDALDKMNINWGIEGAQSKFALVTKLSLLPDDLTPANKDEIAIKSSGGASTITYPGYSIVVDTKNDGFDSDAVISQFKKRGLIPENNRTNIKNDIFESSTGELYLDAVKNFMSVDTPRLQGICAEAKTKAELSNLAVTRMSKRGCIAAVSVDSKPLYDSERIVILYVTNALNSGMEFKNDSMKELISRGQLPILYETGKFTFKLKNKNADSFKLYALGLNGERVQELNARADADSIRASIDTSKIKDAPSVFFELVKE